MSQRAGPSTLTLATLVGAVLAVHAALLLDSGVWTSASTPSPSTFTLPSPSAPSPTAQADKADRDSTSPPPQPVTLSTVRWIEAAPVTSAPPARAAAAAKPKPRPRPPRPAAPALPPADPTPEASTPPETTAVAMAEPPQEPMHSPANTPPDPAPSAAAEPTASAAPAAAPLQAQAAPPGANKGTPLPPATLPPSTQLSYDVTGRVKGFDYQASGLLDWTRDGDRYAARMEIRMFLFGSREQTSAGTVTPQGLRPERFSDKSRSERAAHFEWAKGRIRFSNNAPEASLLPGAQDRLSLFLQLAGLLQAQPRAKGDTIEFQVAGPGGAEVWRFEVGAEETLMLPAGPMAARRVVRLPREEHDSTVEVWFAPSMGHLPVRMRISQSQGDVADQVLNRHP